MLQKVSTTKLLQSSRETNTPHVIRLDVGLDPPRFPGHEVACSTKVIVTADASTATDTLSHSSAVTSPSRDLIPLPPGIDWLFIPPTDQAPTGNGITLADRKSVDEVTPVHRQADRVPIFDGEDLSDGNLPSGRSLKAFVAAPTGTSTSGVPDDARNTVEMTKTTATTHVDVQPSALVIDSQSIFSTNTNAVLLISRRAHSMPPGSGQFARTNHRAGTCSDDVLSGVPTNIPDSQTSPPTYQLTLFDSRGVVPERGDGIHDDGHVVNRIHVPPLGVAAAQQFCSCCRRAIIEEPLSSSVVKDPSGDTVSDDVGTDHYEWIGGTWRSTNEGQTRGQKGQTRHENARYEDRSVGSDDSVCPAVERGVGSGTVWTDSRGTGDRTVLGVDAATWTPTVAVVDRASGTKPVRLVNKGEATDSQETASVGTSPAEDITSAYCGLLAATQPRRVTVSRGTATPPAPATVDRQTVTEHGRLVDRGTGPVVDVTAAYRGALGPTRSTVTVSRGTMTAPLPAGRVDKNTETDCVMVDRASSPIKVCFAACPLFGLQPYSVQFSSVRSIQ